MSNTHRRSKSISAKQPGPTRLLTFSGTGWLFTRHSSFICVFKNRSGKSTKRSGCSKLFSQACLNKRWKRDPWEYSLKPGSIVGSGRPWGVSQWCPGEHRWYSMASPLKPPSPAWIAKRKLPQSNLSTGAESSDSFCSSSFVSSQVLPLNKLISSYTFLLAWVKVFDHEIFQFYEE